MSKWEFSVIDDKPKMTRLEGLEVSIRDCYFWEAIICKILLKISTFGNYKKEKQ